MNFTPTWRTSGAPGQPTLGSGTLSGVVDDETGDITISLEYGEDTNGGEGYWIFGIPVGTVDFWQMNPNGDGNTVDPNGQQYVSLALLDRNKGEFTLETDMVFWSAHKPYTFEPGSIVTIVFVPRVVL